MLIKKLKEKGLFRFIKSVFKIAYFNIIKFEDLFFDLKYSTDTTSIEDPSSHSLVGQSSLHGSLYQPTRARPFRKLLRKLNLPKNSTFVDYGCGKGRILLLAAEYGFKHIVGIDYSPKLCKISQNNIDIFLKNKSLSSTSFSIINEDASVRTVENSENVFFMFNPFDAKIVSDVVRNISLSLKDHPRKCWIIYVNPYYSDAILSHNTFSLSAKYNFDTRNIFIYTTEQ